MPNPGDRVYKISRINVDQDGTRCRVELLVGTVPEAGETQYKPQMVQVNLTAEAPNAIAATNAAAFSDFKAAIASALLNENEPIVVAGAALSGMTLLP